MRSVSQIVMRSCRQQWDDVRVLQRGDELYFPLEAIDVHSSRHFRRQEFDDDFAVEGLLCRQVDPAHSTAAEFPLEAVRVAEGGLEAVEEVGHKGLR